MLVISSRSGWLLELLTELIRRRGGDRGIFTEEGVDTVAYFGGNHGSRV